MAMNSTLRDCLVKDTIVNSTFTISGGFVGIAMNACLQNCYYLGNSGDPNAITVQASYCAGGLIGKCSRCSASQCGVENGQIFVSNSSAGGIIGEITGISNFSEIYLTSNVTVLGVNASTYVGGMIGILYGNTETVCMSNSYSQANVRGALKSGALFGCVANSVNLEISNGL